MLIDELRKTSDPKNIANYVEERYESFKEIARSNALAGKNYVDLALYDWEVRDILIGEAFVARLKQEGFTVDSKSDSSIKISW